jgi:hypothetical protein
MAVTLINVGTSANDNTGDTLRNAFIKTNTNFDILSTTNKLTSGDLAINDVRVGRGAGNIGTNTVVGAGALISNTSGYQNTSVGNSSMYSNLSGSGNTAIGRAALNLNTTEDNNTAIGKQAMMNSFANTSTALGVNALQDCNGDNNVGVGVNTLLSTQGMNNTAIGSYAMLANYNGYDNCAVGHDALVANTSGYGNTAIGKLALSNNTIFFNSTGLGNNAQVEGSNQIQLGSGVTTCYTNGALQNRSDLRDKAEVRNTVLGLDFINELRPVDYKWDMREDYRSEMPIQLGVDATEEEKDAYKILMDEWLESVKLENITHDGTHTRTRYHHGLIAQEVQDVIEASGVDFGGFQDHKVNGGGDVLSLGYSELIAPMIKAIQELTARINVLEGN